MPQIYDNDADRVFRLLQESIKDCLKKYAESNIENKFKKGLKKSSASSNYYLGRYKRRNRKPRTFSPVVLATFATGL